MFPFSPVGGTASNASDAGSVPGHKGAGCASLRQRKERGTSVHTSQIHAAAAVLRKAVTILAGFAIMLGPGCWDAPWLLNQPAFSHTRGAWPHRKEAPTGVPGPALPVPSDSEAHSDELSAYARLLRNLSALPQFPVESTPTRDILHTHRDHALAKIHSVDAHAICHWQWTQLQCAFKKSPRSTR